MCRIQEQSRCSSASCVAAPVVAGQGFLLAATAYYSRLSVWCVGSGTQRQSLSNPRRDCLISICASDSESIRRDRR